MPDLKAKTIGVQIPREPGNTAYFFGLFLPLVIFCVRAVPFLAETEVPIDAKWVYLPGAQRILDDFHEFWMSPDILKVGPLTSFYMALAGASFTTVKSFNLALSMGIFLMLFDAARRISGVRAGIFAAWCFALSPYMVMICIRVMTEPLFLFCTALWIWSSVWSVQARGKKAWCGMLISALALAGATLTRATWVYWVFLMPAVFFLLSRFPAFGDRGNWRRFACIHLVAATCIGGYMLRNAAVFDRPVVSLGTGVALYFGNNPMLHGQEPPFFGLLHDQLVVTGKNDHLSPEGDRLLLAATQGIVTRISFPELVSLYAKKAATFLFFSKIHLRNKHFHRLWRIALVLFSVFGVWHGRKNPCVLLIAAAALYQWAAHVPVLYNPRYSHSALDIPLVLLASMGIAWQTGKARNFLFSMALLLPGLLAGAWHQRHTGPVVPEIASAPYDTLKTAQPEELKFEGLDADPFAGFATSVTGKFSLTWESDFPAVNPVSTLLDLPISRMHGRCKKVFLQHANHRKGEMREDMVLLHGMSSPVDIVRGMLFLSPPSRGSSVRWVFECTPGVRMQFAPPRWHETRWNHDWRFREND